MLVNFDKTGRVVWYNTAISKEDAMVYFSEDTVWQDTDMPETENREGYEAVFYVNEDMQSIRVEYEPIPAPEPSQLDRMEAQLNKSQDKLRQEGADMMMSELVKRGLMV